MAVLGAFAAQQRRQPLQRVGAVRRAGGVVRGVDEHGGGGFVQQGLGGGKVDLEVLAAGRHHRQGQARALHIGLVFREKRRKGENFLSRNRHAAQRVGQRPRRAAGHEDVVFGIVHAEPAVEAVRHGGAHGGQREGGAVAVEGHRLLFRQQPPAHLGEMRRAGHRGVAQRIVKHVLIADFRAPGGAPFRQLTDNGLALQHSLVLFRDHSVPRPFLFMYSG